MPKTYTQLTTRISAEARKALDKLSPPRKMGETLEGLIMAAQGLAVRVDGAWRIYWGPGPLPAGAEAKGIIIRDGYDTGALILLSSGQYVQGNAGAIRTLNQRDVAVAIKSA